MTVYIYMFGSLSPVIDFAELEINYQTSILSSLSFLDHNNTILSVVVSCFFCCPPSSFGFFCDGLLCLFPSLLICFSYYFDFPMCCQWWKITKYIYLNTVLQYNFEVLCSLLLFLVYITLYFCFTAFDSVILQFLLNCCIFI